MKVIFIIMLVIAIGIAGRMEYEDEIAQQREMGEWEALVSQYGTAGDE